MSQYEKRMFGMTKGEVIESPRMRRSGVTMHIISVLSDAQATMDFGNIEAANALINIAKFWTAMLEDYLSEGGEVTEGDRFSVTIEDLDEFFGWR